MVKIDIAKPLMLSSDLDKIFSNNVVVIVGLSRSGTSVLGKIAGSLKNVMYLFEPVIIRYLPVLAEIKYLDIDLCGQLLKGILFEDYYLQLLQGRNLNLKEEENSYFGHYQDMEDIRKRWGKYKRRNDLLPDIYEGKYTFMFKISEVHTLLPVLGKIFKGLKVIHMVRDGNEVISSSLKRGWYSDEFLNYYMSQWTYKGKTRYPWYIKEEDVDEFCNWNRETRIAYIWKVLTKTVRDTYAGKDNYLELRYEKLIKDPETTTRLCTEFLGLKKTDITDKNIIAVKEHILTKHIDLSFAICDKQRAVFNAYMKELDYL